MSETPDDAEAAHKRKPKRLRNEEHPETSRALPASEEAEQGILCSALLQPDTIGAAIERGVSKRHFHFAAHGLLWEHVVAMWSAGVKIDIVTLTQRLHDHGCLELAGGALKISQLFNYLPSATNADYYCQILEDKHTLREMISTGERFASRGYDDQHDVPALVDQFEQAVFSIRQFKRNAVPSMHDLAASVYDDFQASFERGGGISGLSTGFPDIDVQIDGMHPAEMIVIAARPSHGKTALAMNIVEHLAVDLKKPVGVFSLEMSAKQLVSRLMCSRAKVNFFRWRDGFRTQRDCDALCTAFTEVSQAPILIDDTSGLSIQEAKAKARRWKSESGIEAVFMDYLQLFTSRTRRAQENRQLEVSEVSAGTKAIAKDLEIPVIALAQLDRAVDKQTRDGSFRRIRLSDLRESGAIEQDADVVAGLWREEMYAETEEDKRKCEGKATLEILKQRSGPLGPIRLIFLKEFTKFVPPSYAQEPEIDTQPEMIADDPRAHVPKKGRP